MEQIVVTLTRGTYGQWWAVDRVAAEQSATLKHVTMMERLAVFTSLQAVNDYIATRKLEQTDFKEYAIDTTPKEVR